MRIGIFDPYLDSLSGGEKYVLAIAECLASKHEVVIFWDTQQERGIKEKAKQKLGIDISSVVFAQNIFSKDVSFVSRINSSRKYDAIIYLSDGSIPFVLSRLYIHFQFPVEWVKRNYLNSLKLKKISAVFCNSSFTKGYIDKKFRINSAVLYPPIYIPSLHKVRKENIILNVGRFGLNIDGSNYKKQDVLIRVFKSMVDNDLKKWTLVLIVGLREENQDKLLELKKLSNGYPIHFIENPSNNLLWEYYHKSKIYWHASGFGEDLVKYPERAEHFGISTVEAMGLGSVPIVINAGGQKEIIEDTKSGFLWNTVDELISNTDRLVHNERLFKQISQEAVRRSKIFSGNRFCRELNNIIFNYKNEKA
ncbi:MAG: glycosyltransferase family 4 protein [Patescibacteria group bacterium]